MELKQLRSFAAVVKWGSFTRAAEVLYLSQPTISAHIRQLEEELHTKLILRTTKNLTVTPKGKEIYQYAGNILELHERMVRCCAGEDTRTIRLGASTIPAAYLLPELLPAYRARCPEVQVAVRQSDSLEVISGLRDGMLDAGMAGMPAQEEHLVSVPFYQDRMVLITPVNEHFLALRREASPSMERLTDSPFILREEGSGSRWRGDRLLEQLGIPEQSLHVAARASDQETIKNLVACGLGVSILSEKAAQPLIEAGRVLGFTFPGVDSQRALYLIYQREPQPKQHIRKFLRFAKEFYHADPG